MSVKALWRVMPARAHNAYMDAHPRGQAVAPLLVATLALALSVAACSGSKGHWRTWADYKPPS